MNVPRYAHTLARLLARNRGSGLAPPGDRERGVLTIERALAQRKRRSRWRVAGAAALLAGLAAGTLLFFSRPVARPHAGTTVAERKVQISVASHKGTATVDHASVRRGLQLLPGEELEVARGGAVGLLLSTGTAIDLGGESAIVVREQGANQRFMLEAGAFEARVAKLARDERFIVETPDAEVEVRGTEFRVEVLKEGSSCPDGSRTRLTVHEGVVEVRARGGVVRVGAGGLWPADCGLQEGALRPAPTTAPSAAPVDSLQSAPRAVVEQPPHRSALAAQNDLFAEGVAARRRGDANAALAAYGRLINEYPSSALAENALIERMRLLSRSDKAAAQREAQRYIQRYPSGFARQEAEQISKGSP